MSAGAAFPFPTSRARAKRAGAARAGAQLKAKAAQVPLWKLLGGAVRERVRAYNTDIGWLSIPDDALVAGAAGAVDAGLHRRQDQGRLRRRARPAPPRRACAARSARTSRWRSTATASGTCRPACASAAPAERIRRVLVRGAALVRRRERPCRLARATRIPVALGEQLYTQDAFAEFLHRRRIALGAARRHAHGRPHGGAGGCARPRIRTACRSRRTPAT